MLIHAVFFPTLRRCHSGCRQARLLLLVDCRTTEVNEVVVVVGESFARAGPF